MGKPTICIGENKLLQISFAVTAKLISAFDRYTDSTIPLLPKSEISSFWPASDDCTGLFVSGLLGTQIVGYLTHRLKSFQNSHFNNTKLNVILRLCALHFNLFENVIGCYGV